jgi:hypothetical protein
MTTTTTTATCEQFAQRADELNRLSLEQLKDRIRANQPNYNFVLADRAMMIRELLTAEFGYRVFLQCSMERRS